MRNERSPLSGSADSSISARRSPPASSAPCATGKIFSTGFQSSTHLPTTRSELTSAGNDSLRGTKTPAGNRNGNSRTSAKDGLRIGRCDPKKSDLNNVDLDETLVHARLLTKSTRAGRSEIRAAGKGTAVRFDLF